ncbi:MAG: polymer-forming cytoskeletal protein [Candidatus Binatus sp.]|uniref:bactofilin family protein n=1 Tax=Candidatus Binatus sp. TaxID=2811406 RepID=UPI002723E674|nr:polymer-forming cytoskeletal protein [Candidatus Binatus sp.]MDO8434674.1 polymer-forming cytoskeletal protein [Candidatus Binatus sp.]
MATELNQHEQWRREGRPGANADNSAYSKLIPNDPGTAWAEEPTRVAVGRNVNVSGKLIFDGPMRIEGRFKGEVRSAELLVIAEDATVEGKICAPRLLVMGELRGDITGCERLVLGPRAKMFGNIEARNLTIREGAYLEGEVRMTGFGAAPAGARTISK